MTLIPAEVQAPDDTAPDQQKTVPREIRVRRPKPKNQRKPGVRGRGSKEETQPRQHRLSDPQFLT